MDLKSAREQRGWDQPHVAMLIGARSVGTVSKHETGFQYPSPDFMEKYLAIYAGLVTEADIRKTHRDYRKRSSADQAAKEPANA